MGRRHHGTGCQGCQGTTTRCSRSVQAPIEARPSRWGTCCELGANQRALDTVGLTLAAGGRFYSRWKSRVRSSIVSLGLLGAAPSSFPTAPMTAFSRPLPLVPTYTRCQVFPTTTVVAPSNSSSVILSAQALASGRHGHTQSNLHSDYRRYEQLGSQDVLLRHFVRTPPYHPPSATACGNA